MKNTPKTSFTAETILVTCSDVIGAKRNELERGDPSLSEGLAMIVGALLLDN